MDCEGASRVRRGRGGRGGRAPVAVEPAMWRLVGAVALSLVILVLAPTPPVGAAASPTSKNVKDPLIVHTRSGSLQGSLENVTAGPGLPPSQARSFKGIPFGTVKRWQPPLPVVPWNQVRPALAFGATCETAEQCLFLNVNTPWPLKPDVTGRGLAVLLFIHGGCNKGGAGSDFRTEELVAAAKDVIVVTLNYRLGVSPSNHLLRAAPAATITLENGDETAETVGLECFVSRSSPAWQAFLLRQRSCGVLL